MIVEGSCRFYYFTPSLVYLPLRPTVSQFKRHSYQISRVTRMDFPLGPMVQELMTITRQPEIIKGNICYFVMFRKSWEQ